MLRNSLIAARRLNIRTLSTNIQHKSTKQNINEKEISILSSNPSEWWDTNGQMKPLHVLNQVRIPFIRDGLISSGIVSTETIRKPDVLNGLKILDVGCGAGILTEKLARLKAQVTGLDASQELIEAAKNHSQGQQLDVEYICSTIEEHSISNSEKYDGIIISEVLEHIPDQKTFLSDCIKCLKVGGSVFITTINKTQISWLAAVIIAENVLNIIAKGTHDWNNFISPADVSKILNDLNCTTVLVHGIRYEFWRGVACFQKNDSINYALHAVKHS